MAHKSPSTAPLRICVKARYIDRFLWSRLIYAAPNQPRPQQAVGCSGFHTATERSGQSGGVV